MATSATALSSFSSLSIHTSHPPTSSFSFKPTSITYSPFSISLKSTSFTSPLSFSHKPQKLKPPRAESQDDIEPTEEDAEEEEPKSIDDDTFFYELETDEDIVFEPATPPEGYIPLPDFDELPPETEDEIAEAYEKLYGPAYSGVSVLNNDIYVMDGKMKKLTGGFGKPKRERIRDGFEERVVQVRRVTKVVKGGKQMNFRAIVIVGDRKSHVGVGVGKAKEVISAVQKASTDARRHMITVPMTKYLTFPHRSDGKYGAASVMLRPASPGTGVIAGGAVRTVLEMAGVNNALGKQLGSNNALNNARATVVAIEKMRQFAEVAEYRGIPMEELWK